VAAALRLCRALIESHPGEAARILESLSAADAAGALEQLRPEEAARTLKLMERSRAAACLERWSASDLPRIVAALPAEVLAGVVGRADAGSGQRLLTLASPDVAESARRQVLHAEHSAGALMNPRVTALPQDINAGEARLGLRRQAERISYYVYVVDREQRLVGVVTLRQLMQAAAKQPLVSLLGGRVASLSAHAGVKAILDHPGWRAFHALPVVDGKGALLGVLTYETLRALEQQGGGSRGPSPLAVGFALMELYWSAATGMVEGIAGMARTVAEREVRGVDHGS
jgi:magnesium transporter